MESFNVSNELKCLLNKLVCYSRELPPKTPVNVYDCVSNNSKLCQWEI